MTTQNLSLLNALGAKMDYLNQRQRVISQNIANADTPGYRPQDLTAVDFGQVLKDIAGDSKSVRLETTNGLHMPAPGEIAGAKSKKQKETYEVAPAGNAVIMEEQMVNAGQTMMDYNLMTSLYEKNVRMMRTALGAQG
jgi:flagellar basal-body rod protein FlgB